MKYLYWAVAGYAIGVLASWPAWIVNVVAYAKKNPAKGAEPWWAMATALRWPRFTYHAILASWGFNPSERLKRKAAEDAKRAGVTAEEWL